MSSKIFTTRGSILEDRLDIKFYLPQYLKMIEKIEESKFSKANLHELCREPIHRGKTPEYSEKGTIPVIKIVNLKNSWVDKEIDQFVLEKFYNKNTRCRVEKEDILLASTGVGSLGKVDILDDDRKYVVDGHITIIRIKKEEINPYFLLMYLRSRFGQIQIERYIRGTTGQIELYPQDIKKIKVICPDREIQNKVGNKIKKALEMKKKVREMENGLDEFVIEKLKLEQDAIDSFQNEKFFISEIEDRLDIKFYLPHYLQTIRRIEESPYPVKKIEKLSFDIKRGKTPSKNEYLDKGKPILKTINITDRGIDWDEVSYVSEEFYKKNDIAKVSQNNILIASTGVGSLGKTDIYIGEDKCLSVAELSIVIVNENKVDPFFLLAYLRTKYGQTQIERYARGATGQTHLYPRDIKKIKIPVPPKNVQKEIGIRIKKIIEFDLEFKNLLREAEREVEGLI